MRTLLIDNYDSFTFNLFHLLGEVNGAEPIVVRNDELPWDELAALPVDNVVISPGPGRPERERDVGASLDVLRRIQVPVLGVCLGHQALAHVTGGAIEHAPEVMHGRLSSIHHDGRGLFADIPQGFAAVRYHSLVVGTCPAELRVTAWTPDRVVMGLEHRTRPRWGVQFHPESISTEHGRTLVRNFRDLTRAQGRRSARAPRAARGANVIKSRMIHRAAARHIRRMGPRQRRKRPMRAHWLQAVGLAIAIEVERLDGRGKQRNQSGNKERQLAGGQRHASPTTDNDGQIIGEDGCGSLAVAEDGFHSVIRTLLITPSYWRAGAACSR
jgi:anthranilate synthase/aminodeoxychorismate synthase-like glutamine amidotransferase